MAKFPKKLQALSSKHKKKHRDLDKLLLKNDDIIALILRSHLIAEESLYDAIAAYCQNPDRLLSVQLRFPQLVNLLRCLEKMPFFKEQDWAALTELNALRNVLAHRAEPGDLSARIEHLVKMILPPEKLRELKYPLHSKQSLTSAMCYFLGRLDGFAFGHTALEESILLRLTATKKKLSSEAD
jgi:uncharacterized protein YutE (UPF0331/DUF86 family)